MSKAIALTITRAPNPHQPPPIGVATRRDLFGTMGAMLLLTAAKAGASKAAELDRELLASVAEYHDASRRYFATNGSDLEDDALQGALAEERQKALLRLVETPARTPEGLQAKAGALRAALLRDVPVYLVDTFEGVADDHELLAMSLARDVLGREGA